MSKRTGCTALTCYQSTSVKGAAKLALAVIRAAAKVKPETSVRVYLDEAMLGDQLIFSTVPFLPSEHAICVLVGEPEVVAAFSRTMVRAGRRGVFARALDTAPSSLRLQAIIDAKGIAISEESPYFDAKLLAKSALPVERLPAEMPLL